MSSGAMASAGGKRGKSKRSFLAATESEEQDMTPMMNILIILISFLVTMVVFTHIAVVKFNLPPTQGDAAPAGEGETGTATPTQQKDLTVLVSESGYQLLAEGKPYDPRPKTARGYDGEGLAKDLQDVKSIMPFNSNVVLLIDSAVLYQDIITTMDICRENHFPKILLSGGLSE